MSLILPVLLTIYLSEIFREVKAEVEICKATSFADNCERLVSTNLVEQQYEQLAIAVIKAIE